jgi:succinate dehydrogenase / fumarate reductase cytochrome b subunit
MFQTVGFANDTWYPRLKCIANVVATLIFLGFAVVAVLCFLKSGEYMTEMLHWTPGL